MKVLSLFDGISCGRVALERAGIPVEVYYASEIKEDAINVSKDNYPDIIQVGDITKLKGEDFKDIDLIIGGSPCQSFSRAGKREGFDGKSKLFWEFVRLLREIKPKYFFLENVKMKKEWQDIISEELGVEPININSKLVSAQLRNRFYWTNIPNISEPENRGVILKDILESGYTDRVKSRAVLESDSRPNTTPIKMFHRYYSTGFTTLIFKDKSHYDNCVEHYNLYFNGLSASELDTKINNNKINLDIYNGIRYLNQKELEKLQTLPDGYTKSLKRNNAAGVIGDGWTVDVIAHLFRGLLD